MENIFCNLCRSRESRVIYRATTKGRADCSHSFACSNAGHGEYFQMVRCNDCGLFYSSPRPAGGALEKLYGEVHDPLYKEELEGRVRTFSRNLQNLKKYKATGKLLDVGCSLGLFLDLARKDGWEIRGVEPSKWCVEEGKKLFSFSNEVSVGSTRELEQWEEKFDAVTLWDVLEHLEDPLQALKNCRRLLKEDGILAFSTVDIGSLYARILGQRWPWLMRMHIYYFDKKTIRKYLKKAGLKLLKIKTYRHTVSFNYLLYKLKSVSTVLHTLAGGFKKVFLFDKNIFLTFALGDFMEVYCAKDETGEGL